MDWELSGIEDPIQTFLRQKLQEVRAQNAELDEQTNRRRQLLDECLQRAASTSADQKLAPKDTWHRTLNDKWVVGVRLRNANEKQVATNLKLVLSWNSTEDLTYSTKIYSIQSSVDDEDEWRLSNTITKEALLLLAFDLPNFTETSNYKIEGILTYDIKEEHYQMNILNFELNPESIFAEAFDVGESKEAQFSTIIASEAAELAVWLKIETGSELIGSLEKCGFVRAKGHRFLYVLQKPDILKGSLLELARRTEEVYEMTTYTRNEKVFELLLHFLHRNVPQIVILPKIYTEEIINMDKSDLLEFGKAMEEEMGFVNDFFRNKLSNALEMDDEIFNIDMKVYKKFRDNLADLEYKTDVSYSSVLKAYNKNRCSQEMEY